MIISAPIPSVSAVANLLSPRSEALYVSSFVHVFLPVDLSHHRWS